MYRVRSSIIKHLSLMNTFGVTGPRFLRPAGTREADGECLQVPLSQEIGRHSSVQSTREQCVPAQLGLEQTCYAKLYAQPTMSA